MPYGQGDAGLGINVSGMVEHLNSPGYKKVTDALKAKSASGGNAWDILMNNMKGSIQQPAPANPFKMMLKGALSNLGPGEEQQPVDELDALFQQLMGAVQSQRGAGNMDYESALQQSEQAIRDAYAGDIQAIRSGNKIARRQTARNREELEGMYNALAKTYNRSGRRAARQAERRGDVMQRNANQSSRMLGNQAQGMLDEQAQMAQDLGIVDAVASANEPLQTEAMDQAKRIQKEGARDANRQIQYGGNAQEAFEKGGQNARLAGVNRSADLLADLQDYLQGNRAEINQLKGQRGREIAANEQSVMGSMAELQQAQDSDMWDRLMQLAGLKLDIEKEQNSQASDLAKMQQQVAGGSGLPENFEAAQQYLGQLNRPNVGTKLFDQLLREPEIRYGQTQHPNTKEMYKTTPYEAMDMIQRLAEQEGLSPQDVNLLRLAIFSQLG